MGGGPVVFLSPPTKSPGAQVQKLGEPPIRRTEIDGFDGFRRPRDVLRPGGAPLDGGRVLLVEHRNVLRTQTSEGSERVAGSVWPKPVESNGRAAKHRNQISQHGGAMENGKDQNRSPDAILSHKTNKGNP